jgi:hypothetical protein
MAADQRPRDVAGAVQNPNGTPAPAGGLRGRYLAECRKDDAGLDAVGVPRAALGGRQDLQRWPGSAGEIDQTQWYRLLDLAPRHQLEHERSTPELQLGR